MRLRTATAAKKKAAPKKRLEPVASQKPEMAAAPAQLGYRWPAEWEPHAATWIAWPHNREDWPGKFSGIQWVYTDIVRWIAKGERAEIIVNDRESRDKAAEALIRAHVPMENVRFHLWPTDRVWLRDSGPIFLKRDLTPEQEMRHEPKLAITNWRFNAWAKYDNWQNDDKLPSKAARLLGVPEWQPTVEKFGKQVRIVLEGGSIDGNGQGTLLTTEECLLSEIQQRNPLLTREDYEQIFEQYLGVKKVIWLDRGVAGDDTHGHVDDITRFVSADTVVTAIEPNLSEVNYEPLAENLRRLNEATDARGNKLQVVPLPLPSPVNFRTQRLPASYANFYICNAAILVPTFNDPNDRLAMNILADLFPKREIVGIHSGDFIWGLGAMHCMTQQQPEC